MANARSPQSTKRQLIAQAQEASLESRWEDAVAINDKLAERFPRQADALNRKGRALIELRQLAAARDAYSEALKADPANMIARRNLQRLEMLYARPQGEDDQTVSTSTIPRTTVFIEEVGKTWVDELANPADLGVLAQISPGEKLELEVVESKIQILGSSGERLGEVDARIAQRMVDLIAGGNEYEIYALGVSSQSLRVIIREVHKSPEQASRISFPRQMRGTQELMRERELLFQREEGDFNFGEEVDDEDDVPDVEDDVEPEDDPDVDTDARAFVDDSVNDDEEQAAE